MLELVGVSKIVEGRTHIHETTLTLEPGSMNVLLGPTLAGKTTLMRLMAGLDLPSTGRIIWNGKDVTGMRVQDRGVAMVYQQFVNYPSMTVFDNIASPLRLARRPAAEIDRKVRETARLLRLEEMLDRQPLELSGGQQQRCALARALVKGAGLVLLDEPLANLDYKLREELRAEIPRIFEGSGAVFVYATTEPEEALLLSGNTATLWEGRVTQFGATPQVYRCPGSATTARVFSDPPMNFTPLSKQGNTIRIGDCEERLPEGPGGGEATGPLARLADGEYLAGFRPNHLHLRQPGATALRFRCRLRVIEITGSETFVHLDQGGERWVGLIHGIHDLEIGAQIDMWLDAAHIYVFAPGGELVAPAAYAAAA